MVRFEFKLQNHGFCFGIFLRLSEALQIFNMSWKLIISQPESYQILEIHFFFCYHRSVKQERDYLVIRSGSEPRASLWHLL